MRKGASSQFITRLKAICFQISRVRKTRCSVSNWTLHKIGYIITSSPIAVASQPTTTFSPRTPTAPGARHSRSKGGYQPIGTETPTNFPFCSAELACGTKFPSMMPIAMASSIQSARRRSNQPRFLNAEVFSATTTFFSSCFSESVSTPASTGAISSWLGDADGCELVAPARSCLGEVRVSFRGFVMQLILFELRYS